LAWQYRYALKNGGSMFSQLVLIMLIQKITSDKGEWIIAQLSNGQSVFLPEGHEFSNMQTVMYCSNKRKVGGEWKTNKFITALP
jgi:hypothetical protein